MSDAPESNEDGGRPGSERTRTMPDIAACRAKRCGFDDYVECLVPDPYPCQFALTFGYGCFCRHPQRAEIVVQTDQGGPSVNLP